MSYEDDIKRAFDNAQKEMRIATVLVCGGTGVGKSTLIRTMFDLDVPISHSRPCTQSFDEYKTERVRVIDSRGHEKGESVSKFVETIGGIGRHLKRLSPITIRIKLLQVEK